MSGFAAVGKAVGRVFGRTSATLAAAGRTRVLVGALVVAGVVAGGWLAANAAAGPPGPAGPAAVSLPPATPSASPHVTAPPTGPVEEPIHVFVASDTVNPAALRQFRKLCVQQDEARINCSSAYPQGAKLDAEVVTSQIFRKDVPGLLFWGCDEPSPSSRCQVTFDRPRTIAVTTTAPTDRKYADTFQAMYRDGRLGAPPSPAPTA